MSGSKAQGRNGPVTWPLPGTPASRQSSPHWSRLRTAARVALALVLLLIAGLGVAYWRLSATVTNYPGSHFNSGRNAVWLEHSWAGQPHSEAEYDQLTQRLAHEQITYVFAHVGPLQSDGTIPPSLAPNAEALVQALRARLPNVKVLAWIGQVEAAGGYSASDSIDLDQSDVRTHIAQTAAHFVSDLGFDGVHYDIEPIVNNNPRFLDLLTETRARLPAGALLSTVGEKWAPNAHLADLLYGVGRASAWWTSYYYAAVAAHVDQLVAMLYDTGMPAPGLYSLTVQEESEHILEAVRSARTPPQLLVGIPTYTGDSVWFHSAAENMQTGLTGVIAGLNSNRDTSAFTGVAIYRFGSTGDADWVTYDRLWLGAS